MPPGRVPRVRRRKGVFHIEAKGTHGATAARPPRVTLTNAGCEAQAKAIPASRLTVVDSSPTVLNLRVKLDAMLAQGEWSADCRPGEPRDP